VNTASRICLGLGAFLAVAGLIYRFTSHEPAGTTLLLVAAVTFGFLSVVMRIAARRAPPEGSEEVEVHVEPTIWPLGFAVSGVVIAVGLIVSPWVLVVGGAGFALSAWGWLRDVTRSHASEA
jgi:ABC-type Fe3+ transport system permease subunit